MTLAEKKETERSYFERLSAKISVPSGEIDYEVESPDILVRGENDTLGIEVTRLFKECIARGRPLQADESEQAYVVQAALEKAREKRIPPLIVTVYFSPHSKVTKSNRNALVDHIVQLVLENIPAEYGHAELGCEYDAIGMLPSQIEEITVDRSPMLSSHCWKKGTTGFVNDGFSSLLQKNLNTKNALMNSYLEKCDHCWLILAADGNDDSSFLQFSTKMQEHCFVSAFDRTFFVDGLTSDVYELRTSKPSGVA